MRTKIATILLILGSASAASGCVGGSSDKKTDQETLKAYVLDKAPDDVGNKLGINYDNKVTLLGAKVSPEKEVRPGQRVKLTMYWEAKKDITDKGWKLFTHVVDGSGERILNIDNVGALRTIRGKSQALPPSEWQEGKVYVDEQSFTVPRKIKSSSIQVTVGIWKGADRLPIVGGPKDRGDRGIAATLKVKGGRDKPVRQTRVPELRVNRLEKGVAVKIDGKLDEDAWKGAARTGSFVDVRTGRVDRKGKIGGNAKLLWDDKGLYVGFQVKDQDVTGGFDPKAKDPHLWTKDTVEIMIDPDGDGDNKDYYEIQINPQNLVFDSQFDSYNQPKKEPDGPFGHQEWTANVKSAVTIDGTIDKPDDKDKGYTVEAMIPWKSFAKAKQTPPELGDTWRINLYAMENNGGVGWSAILGQGNFHRASRFGKVTWAEKGWKPTAVAELEEKSGETGEKASGGSAKGEAAKPASGTKEPSAAKAKTLANQPSPAKAAPPPAKAAPPPAKAAPPPAKAAPPPAKAAPPPAKANPPPATP